MSLNFDYTKCPEPADENEQATIDSLIWASLAIGMGELTKKNAAEWYARIKFIEDHESAFRMRVITESSGETKQEPVKFTPTEIKRWVGLKTNVPTTTRTRFLKRYESDLARNAREYTDAMK